MSEEQEFSFSKQLILAIDTSVIMETLVTESNWTKIVLRPSANPVSEIKSWLGDYCVGNYMSLFNEYVFENPQDALLFTLKWS
jgi:hypothetical protein